MPVAVGLVALVATVLVWLPDDDSGDNPGGRSDVAARATTQPDRRQPDGRQDSGNDTGENPEAVSDESSPSDEAGQTETVDAKELPSPTSQGSLGVPTAAGALVVTIDGAALEDDSRGREQVVVRVRLRNDTDRSQGYTPNAFSLVVDGGALVRAKPPSDDDGLDLGSLEPGDEVAGTVGFDAGSGDHTLVYDPGDPDDKHRYTWTLEV